MPDSTNPCLTRQGNADSKSAGLAAPPPKVLPVAFPLDDFYMRAGLPLPAIEMVNGAEMPEPCRSLLVHNNDMTPTLAAYHASTIQLQVLSRQQRDDFYFREVVLLADGSEKAVEFGAIRINLALFSPAARQHILQERSPLGHLLGLHAVQHSSRPKAYFRLQADAFMVRALRLAQPAILYGRRNTLLDSVQRPLAEVVEILPPARSK
jgi:hypothetical protein